MEITIQEDERVCANCKYFHQHYVKAELNWTDSDISEDGKRYSPIHTGHCVEPRLKNRKVTDTCINFIRKEHAE